MYRRTEGCWRNISKLFWRNSMNNYYYNSMSFTVYCCLARLKQEFSPITIQSFCISMTTLSVWFWVYLVTVSSRMHNHRGGRSKKKKKKGFFLNIKIDFKFNSSKSGNRSFNSLLVTFRSFVRIILLKCTIYV